MLMHMRPALLIGCLLFVSTTCHADTSCSQQSRQHAIAQASQLRKQLLAIKVEPLSGRMPTPSPQLLERYKIALIQLADEFLACHDTSVAPAALQSEIASLLHANRFTPQRYNDDDTDEPVANVFGTELKVHVSRASASPLILSVQFNFGIPCGDDNVLILFQANGTRWKDVLRWRVKDLNDIGDAFGDFFFPTVVPGLAPDAWRLVTLHGDPWCTSYISGFKVDVLAATSDPDQPKLIAHRNEDYRRNEPPSFTASGNIITMRGLASTIETDVMIRKGIFQYRLVGDDFQRIQPIATNSRYFVDEWLQMPWSDATHFSEPTSLSALKPAHDAYAASLKYPNKEEHSFTTHQYGPVRACTATKQFQVEIRLNKETFVPNIPGGTTEPLPSTYFRVLETGDGYQMLSASTKPDPSCNGRDLMPAKH
jgi:hypothetical protein